jgi:hypothetical protein
VSRRVRAKRPAAAATPPAHAPESPLEWLYRRRDRQGQRLIGPAAFAAGERLRQDFTFGQLLPRTTTNGEITGGRDRHAGGRPGDLSDGAMAARQRLKRALEAVGPELHGVLLDVCCFLKGLEEVEHERHWPSRSAKIVLSLGLEALARHYGYGDNAVGAERRGRIEQWGADDYRPTISES